MSTPFQGIAVNNFYRQAPPMLGDRIRSEIMRLRAERAGPAPIWGRGLRPPTSGQQIEKLEKGQRGLSPNGSSASPPPSGSNRKRLS
jgi:hypothetical protein